MTTLLIAEHDNASVKDSTNKALTAAAALGGDVHVLVAGENADKPFTGVQRPTVKIVCKQSYLGQGAGC